MKYRFIQKCRDGEQVYLPGLAADDLFSATKRNQLIKDGIVTKMTRGAKTAAREIEVEEIAADAVEEDAAEVEDEQ